MVMLKEVEAHENQNILTLIKTIKVYNVHQSKYGKLKSGLSIC